MNPRIYTINKGVNRPITIKGLKAQYVWWLGGGIAGLLIFFALLYIGGVNPFVCLIVTGLGTLMLFRQVYGLSRRYGEHGLMKKRAARGVPKRITIRSRKTFVLWNVS